MITTIAFVVVAILLFAFVAIKLPTWGYCLFMAGWCFGWFLVSVYDGNVMGMVINSGLGAYWLHRFWKHRPPGMRNLAKAIGAKARALKEKLVASMPQAKPVFVPVPA